MYQVLPSEERSNSLKASSRIGFVTLGLFSLRNSWEENLNRLLV